MANPVSASRPRLLPVIIVSLSNISFSRSRIYCHIFTVSIAFLSVWLSAGLVSGCVASRELGKGAVQGASEEVAQEHQTNPHKAPQFEQIGGGVLRGALQAVDEPQTRQRLEDLSGLLAAGVLATATGSPVEPAGVYEGSRFHGGGPQPGGSPMALLGSQFSRGLTVGLGRHMGDDPNLANSLRAIVQHTATDATRAVGQDLSTQLGPSGDGPLGRSLSAAGSLTARTATRAIVSEFSGCASADDRTCIDARVGALGQAVGDGVATGAMRALRIPLLVVAFLAGVVVALLATWAVGAIARRASRAQ